MPYGTAFIETLISNLLNITTKVITEVDRRVTAKALQQLLDALKRADDALVAKVQQIKSLATQVRDLEETNLQQGCKLQEKDISIARLQQDLDFYRLSNQALEEENEGCIRELKAAHEQTDVYRQHLYTANEEKEMLEKDARWFRDQIDELNRLVSALRADLDGTARHAASLENQLKEQQQLKDALETTLDGMTRYANALLKNVPQDPKVETKGFYAMVRWRSDEPDDVSPVEVFIAQTHDDLGDEHVFYYAGDYPEEYIRDIFSRENSHEEWYIVPSQD